MWFSIYIENRWISLLLSFSGLTENHNVLQRFSSLDRPQTDHNTVEWEIPRFTTPGFFIRITTPKWKIGKKILL
jgi:hypothetical protein